MLYLKWRLGETYICAGRYDEAIAHLANTIEVEPNDPWRRHILAKAYLRKSMYLEAITESKKAFELRDSHRFMAKLGHVYALAGQREKALTILKQLQTKDIDRFSLERVELNIALGRKHEALSLLERGVDQRANNLLYIKCSTVPDSLQNNPVFQDIMSRIDFPELSF